MSVIKAILFYSKRDQKSHRMKKIIDNVGADIETVSVDSLEVREILLSDDTYGIDQVPAVLLLYSSGQHKVYTTRGLDDWFDQLLQNIKAYQQQQQAVMQPQETPLYTPIDDGILARQTPSLEEPHRIPKELRRKPGNSTDIPSTLPSPGRPQRPSSDVTTLFDEPSMPGSGINGGGSGMADAIPVPGGGISSAQAAMISEHIKGAEPLIPITSDTFVQPGRKEVKKEGLSAGELAKQMAEQREQFEDKLEENRPFM